MGVAPAPRSAGEPTPPALRVQSPPSFGARRGREGGVPGHGIQPAPGRPARRPRWLVRLVVAAGLLPLAKLIADAALGRLGADPVAEVLNRLGWWALVLLLTSLLPTPLRAMLGWSWPVRLRRALGLLCATYVALHASWYVAIDQGLDAGAIAADVLKHRFVLAGAAGALLLAPLAITSTDAWVRRLGYVRWKRLHRLAYAVGALGAVHFWLRVKADHREPAAFAVAFGALMLLRLRPPRTRTTAAPAARRRASGSPASDR